MTFRSLHVLDAYKIAGFPVDYPTNMRAFFPPVDHVDLAVLACVKSTQRSIRVAMFAFDDTNVGKTVAAFCADPHISVQLSIDASEASATWEHTFLQQFPNTAIAVGHSERGNYMHMKAAVIDDALVLDGATNWTPSGETREDNSLVVIHNAAVAADYARRLDQLHTFLLTQPQPS